MVRVSKFRKLSEFSVQKVARAEIKFWGTFRPFSGIFLSQSILHPAFWAQIRLQHRLLVFKTICTDCPGDFPNFDALGAFQLLTS